MPTIVSSEDITEKLTKERLRRKQEHAFSPISPQPPPNTLGIQKRHRQGLKEQAPLRLVGACESGAERQTKREALNKGLSVYPGTKNW